MLITQVSKEREKVIVTRIALRTMNEFTNFRYEIVVEPTLEVDILRLKVQGLRAPKLSLPSTGSATFVTEYPDLQGRLTIIVSKPDRQENEFVVNIAGRSVELRKGPRLGFIQLVTKEEEW